MESYVEATLFVNVNIMVLSLQLAQYVTLKPISMVRMISYAFLQSICNILLWMENSWMICAIVEMLFFIICFSYAKKTWLVSICLRFLFMATCYVVLGGSFYNMTWFVPIHISFLWLCFVMLLISLLLFLKWDIWFAKMCCVYRTYIYTSKETLRVKGYLDSGNLLTWQGIPVIFLPKKFHTYFKNERIELIVMNTIAQTSVLRCYLCEIRLPGCKRHRVYVHCEKALNLPHGCNALLNMNVITLG